LVAAHVGTSATRLNVDVAALLAGNGDGAHPQRERGAREDRAL
jgi:hypothetical protein